MEDKTTLIRLYPPLENKFAKDKHPVEELYDLSQIFGYDFTRLLVYLDDEIYFRPISDLWNNLHQLPRLNENVHPLDSPEGFRFFYVLAIGRVLPAHCVGWIEKAYEAHAAGLSLLVEAHRESNKTTAMELLLAFKLGLYPALTNMLVRGGDIAAKESGKTISHVVSRNLAFAMLFPNVVPDTGDTIVAGRPGGTWNISAYNVRDTRVSDGEWSQLIAGRKGYSVMVYSPESGGIRGKRVSGVMLLDDLVIARHSRSDAEMQALISETNKAILPTRTESCLTIILGTPQRSGDLLEKLQETGSVEVLHQPLVNPDNTINWPARFSPDEVERRKNMDLEEGRGYETEYQLNRAAFQNRAFESWLTYPAVGLKPNDMYLFAACDPASFDVTGGKHSQSHAAIGICGMDSRSGIYVLVDGWIGQQDLYGLAARLVNTQRIYPTLAYYVIEADGVGQELIDHLARFHPMVKVIAAKTKGLSKEQRLSVYLKPKLTTGQLRISDGPGDYLKRAREAIERYPDISRRGPLQDLLDSLAWIGWMLREGPGSEMIRTKPRQRPEDNPYFQIAKMR